MHGCRGSDRVCRWSFGSAGLFVLWKPHRGRWILGQFFWSFCELAQTGDSDIRINERTIIMGAIIRLFILMDAGIIVRVQGVSVIVAGCTIRKNWTEL